MFTVLRLSAGGIAHEENQQPIGLTWQVDQEGSDQLTPEGHTDVNAIPASNSLKSYSPTNDSLLKYSKDPPALIACVAPRTPLKNG